jgi:glycosyltransferase involved in cell wall biosynthesis
MKISLITNALTPLRGSERIVLSLANLYKSKGHSVQLILMFSGEVKIKKHYGHRVIFLDFFKYPLKSFVFFIKTVRRFKPDVLNAHLYRSIIISRLFKVVYLRAVHISSWHNSFHAGLIHRYIAFITNFLTSNNTNVSNSAAFDLKEKKVCDKITVIYNGIDSKEFCFSNESRRLVRDRLSIGEESKMLLSVGGLSVQKNHEDTLRAMPKIISKFPDVILVIIGSGVEEANIRNMVESMNLCNYVLLLGEISDVSSYMSACDIFVHSPRWEGFGLVLAEAIACKSLVVTYDVDGIKEVVGEFGITTAPNPNDLSKGVILGLSNFNQISTDIIDNGVTHIKKNFSLDSMAENYINLYLLMLKK